MLRSVNDLKGSVVRATDGEIGEIDDVYFEDDRWIARYLLVNTGGWLGRRVLVSPVSVTGVNWRNHRINLSLSKEQVRHSPRANFERPLSRAYERHYFRYYGYPPYWAGMGLWGVGAYPEALASTPTEAAAESAPTRAAVEDSVDPRLHTTFEVIGAHVQATDGEIGHVDDLLIDDETWAIRYAHVDTSNWIGGRPVIVGSAWLREVNWIDGKLHVALAREAVKNSPAYDPVQLNREYEARLHRHYGTRGYWE